MIKLNGSTNILQVLLGESANTQLDWWVSWVQLNETELITGDSAGGQTNSTTDANMVSGIAGNQLKIDTIDLLNCDNLQHIVIFKMDVSGTDKKLFRCVLQPNESVHYAGGEWYTNDVLGSRKVTNASQSLSDYQVFITNGTWTKPTSFTPKFVKVVCIGAGGGGGSGGSTTGGVIRMGGAGGGEEVMPKNVFQQVYWEILNL